MKKSILLRAWHPVFFFTGFAADDTAPATGMCKPVIYHAKIVGPAGSPLTSFAFAWYTHHCEMPHATENKRLFIWLFSFT